MTTNETPLLKIAGYELREEIGRGGMGVVYRARDLGFERDVAIKVLGEKVGADSFAAARFRNEARITGQLQHPGIPAAHELGTLADGKPFLVMKLVRGATLQAMLDQRKSPGEDRGKFIAIFEQICHAVGYAHAHNVIHRDLKPSNVMVGKFGEVQIMDWGLAKVLGESREEEVTEVDTRSTAAFVSSAIETPVGADSATRTGSVLGTPAYMSPEQAGGQIRLLDARSDVFGLGAILCEILTGNPPYGDRNPNEIRIKAVRGELTEAFSRLDACGAEADLVALSKQCLAFKQEDRPANGQAVGYEVERIRTDAEARAREAELAQSAALVREAEGSKRRRQFFKAASAIGAVLLMGILGTSYGLYSAQQSASAETKAKEEAKRKQKEAEDERMRAEDREQEAIDAVKRFGDAVANNPELKNSDKLESLRKELLKEPVEYLKSLCEQLAREKGTRKESLDRLAAVASNLGMLNVEIGDKQDAIRATEQSIALYEQLSHENPDKQLYRRNLAKGRMNLGVLLSDTGNTVDAMTAYDSAKAIFKRLIEENSADEESQYELAILHYNLANLLRKVNRREEALASYEAAILIFERLAREHPLNVRYQIRLASLHSSVGNVLNDVGKLHDALRAHQAALAVLQPHAETHSHEAEFAEALAVSHTNLGILQKKIGLKDDAIVTFKAAHAIWQRLASERPTNTKFQTGLASILMNRAGLLSSAGKTTEAMEALDTARPIVERLVRENSTVTEFQLLLADWHTCLGRLLGQLGKTDEALSAFDAAIARLKRLTTENPEISKFWSALAASHYSLSLLLSSVNERDRALVELEEAKAIQERLTREEPTVIEFQSDLAKTSNNIALLFESTRALAETIKAYNFVITIRERLAREHPQVTEFQVELARCHFNLGRLHVTHKKLDVALTECEAARDVLERVKIEELVISPDTQNLLGGILNVISAIKIMKNDLLAAKTVLLKAVEVQKLSLVKNPDNLNNRRLLKSHYNFLSKTAIALHDDNLDAIAKKGLKELLVTDPEFAALDRRLAAVASGQAATDSNELLALGRRATDLGKFSLAARFYGEAIERAPESRESRRNQIAYHAACLATLAAAGRGEANPPLDDAAKEQLRSQARTWLKIELDEWQKHLDKEATPEARQVAKQALEHWQKDVNLSSVRESEQLAAFAETERKEWETLWGRVKDILEKSQSEGKAETK